MRPVRTGLIALGALLLMALPAAAQEQTYRTAAPATGVARESLMAEELIALQEVVVAGDLLEYDEAAGTARWSGQVTLTAGSLELTTEELLLTFENDPETREPILQTLNAGPQVHLLIAGGLVEVHGTGLNYAFPTQTGGVGEATVRVLLPAELIGQLGELPLTIGDVETTIEAKQVSIQGDNVTIEGANATLLTQAGRTLRISASRLEVLNPRPDISRLRTRNLRVRIDDFTLIRLPWTQTFRLRGRQAEAGFDFDFPHVVAAEEGVGLYTDILYGFRQGDRPDLTWIVGTHFEWIFADRMYVEHYLDWLPPKSGRVRLSYGTVRGVSPLDNDSLPVRNEPELWWGEDHWMLGDWLRIRPELGIGHIREPSTDRESDRIRATFDFQMRPIYPWPGNEHIRLFLRGRLDQRWYDHGWQQRIGEGGVVLQMVDPGSQGIEVSWTRRDDTGYSPFLHDRVRLHEEVTWRQKVMGPDGWSGLLRARYDLEYDVWRNFELGAGKRLDLLEARLLYDTVADAIRFELGYAGEI